MHSGYAIVTSHLSLCELQPTVAAGRRTTFVASAAMIVNIESLTSVLRFLVFILTRTRKWTLVNTCSC